MGRWRRIIGTLLLWTPFLVFGLFSLSGVLLGSMGMDIHWASKEAPYVGAPCVVLFVCACVAAGLKLRKGTKT
jgi:hypothetical protein